MKKITVSILTTLLMLSMVFSSSVFAANDQQQTSAWDSFLGLFGATASSTDVGVEYRGHIQNKGDYPTNGTWIQGPTELGTRGEGLRMEGFWIEMTKATKPANMTIKYNVHVENEGWLYPQNDTTTWPKNGDFAGTKAKGQRIEAINIVLVDAAGNKSIDYDVMYQGHVENVGDVPQNDPKYTGTTGWYMNGDQLGTTGSGLRLEALKIKIVQKVGDLTDYNTALGLVKEADYTAASWTAYKAVLADNVVTTADLNSEIDAATAIILDAQQDLVKVLKVESVSAINAKQIKVVFSNVVDKTTAEATASYALYEAYISDSSKGAATSTANYTRTLLADNKTLIIYKNSGSWTQDTTIGLEVKDVQDKTDATVKVPTTFKTAKNLDVTKPVISSADVLSSKSIKLQASEPINKNDATPVTQTNMITIDGVVAIASFTVDNSTNEIMVNLSSGMAVGSHTLVLQGLRDYANLSIDKTTFTLDVVKDTTPPVIQSATASDRGTITVNFDEPITDIGTLTVAAGAGTTTFNTGNKVATASLTQNNWALSTDGKTATLKLATGNEMGIAAIVEQEIKYSGTKDAEGNTVPSSPSVASYKFKVADDTTLPTVGVAISDVTATKNQLTLTFSKTMSVAPTVTIKNATGVQVYTGTPALDTTNKKATIAASAFGASSIDAATYTIEVKDAQDNTVRQNKMTTLTQSIVLYDTKAPNILGAPIGTVGEKTITINFTEAMDSTTITNKDNYLVAIGGNAAVAFSNVTGSTATAGTDNKSVTLTWTASSLITNASTVTILNVKDVAGNTLATGDFNVAKTVATAPTFTSTNINSVQLTKVNQIKVTTDGTQFGTIDPANFVIAKTTTGGSVTTDDLYVGTAYTLNNAKTEATITLSGNVKTDVTYDGTNVVEVYVVEGNTSNYAGAKLAIAKASSLSIADKVGPVVEVPLAGTFDTLNNTISVPFSETITTSTANIEQALAVRYADGENSGTILMPGTEYTAALTGVGNKTVVITITKAGFNNKATVTLANNTLITDGSSNLATDFAAVTTKNTVAKASAKTLIADTTSNNVDTNMDITFTDDSTWRAAITAVKVGATTLTPTTDYTVAAGAITLKPAGNVVLQSAGDKTITVVATGYVDSTVTQTINAGAFAAAQSTAAISAALAPGGTSTITLTAKDQYSNPVSGYVFKAASTITDTTAVESYTVGGTAITKVNSPFASTLSATNASGVATLVVVMPATLDQTGDGISVQAQLTDGSTAFKSAFAYAKP